MFMQFFIYGCDNKKKISISTPEKDAKEMSVYHKQVLKGEMTITEFENILNSKVNMYIRMEEIGMRLHSF